MSSTARTFDPENVLLRRDISVSEKIVEGRRVRLVRLRLKSTKESRFYCRGTILEVCAFLDYVGQIDPNAPAFRTGEGWALRHEELTRS